MVNFSIASLIQIGLSLVLIFWTAGSKGATLFSIEEEFLQLKEYYIQMKEIVKSLESKVTELESKNTQMEAKVLQQDSLLISLLREKNERTAESGSGITPISSNQSATAINGLPSSCADLKMIGHIWNGFYSVMGTAMMESVYCDFTKPPSDTNFQKWIGYADVKSVPVHFYVQKGSSFSTVFTPIPFDSAVVNDGNAMNLPTGIFTAPRAGTYFFSFTATGEFPASSTLVQFEITLFLNGNRISQGQVTEANTVLNQDSPLTLQSILNLKKNDQVSLQITALSPDTKLVDNSLHRTHFTGFMLEEELVTSL